jgi:hypothetical protein
MKEFNAWFEKNGHKGDFEGILGRVAYAIWKAAEQAERERCAKIADDMADGTGNAQWDLACDMVAKAIREQGDGK